MGKLIQKTVYIREEDIEAWSRVPNKAQFLHDALTGSGETKRSEPLEEPVYVSEEETPMIEKHDLRPKLNPTPGVVIDAGTQCEHGFGPKLCLIKGCKHYQFRKKR